ncbi:helix-turn-helix domain-containing protein [Streptococcus suis]|nr:helix-turn-helix domain-containing protein [Streptococcus suis]
MAELKVTNATNIKTLRKEKRLTQEELAKIIGVTKLTILRWENGDRVPKADKAQLLADYFGVSVEYLLGFDVPRNNFPHEVFTPREYNAWEEYNSLALDKSKLSFDAYEQMRNSRQIDNVYLEIISNYVLSSSIDQNAIRQLARTTAKSHSGHNVNYKADN